MADVPNAANDAMSSSDDSSSVQHLIELGYEDPLVVAERQRHAAAVFDNALKQAQRIKESGALADAITLLTHLAEQAPKSPGPHRLLAEAYYRTGELDVAKRELRWLESHGFEHAEFALLRATIALRRRELDEALDQAEYAQCLRDPLTSADIVIGEVRLRRGELDLADASFQRALAAGKRTAAALAGLAAVSLRRGDFESSVDWALQALEEDMRLPAVHYRLGLALMWMDRRVEAAAALKMAAQLNPHLAAPHRWLSRIYKGSDERLAAEHHRHGRDIVARRFSDRKRRCSRR